MALKERTFFRGDRKDDSSEAASADELKDSESSPSESASSSHAEESESKELDTLGGNGGGGFFNPGKSSFGGNGIFGRGSRGKRSPLAIGAIGGVGITGLILLLSFVGSSLRLKNLSANIQLYQFARNARTLRLNAATLEAEKAIIDSATGATKDTLKRNAATTEVGQLVDDLEPNKIYDNLESADKVSYSYSDPSKLDSVKVNGESIDPADRAKLVDALETKGDAALKGPDTLIRSSYVKELRAKLRIKLEAWKNKGKDYQGLSDEAADVKAVQEMYDNVHEKPEGRSLSDDVQQAADDADAANEQCLANPECVRDEIIAKDGQLPTAAKDAITKGTLQNTLLSAKGVIEAASTVYAIALPACMIYEGSLQNSGPIIDAKSEALQRQGQNLLSAADQQSSQDDQYNPETTAEAVGTYNRALGNTSGSVPLLRQTAGSTYDTNDIASPQAAGNGEYTIFDAFLPEPFKGWFNQFSGTVCPVVTHPATGVATGVVETALAVASEGASKGAALSGKQIVTQTLKKVVTNLLSKRAALRVGVEIAGIEGTSALARMAVVNRMNAEVNGTARDEDLANQSDMGIEIQANDVNRGMMYGRPLTKTESVASALANQTYISGTKKDLGVYDRYFATSNPTSLFSTMSVGVSNSIATKGVFASLISNISNFRFGSLFQGFARPASAAANVDDYGIVQWGMSEEEMAKVRNDPSYQPVANAKALEASGQQQSIADKYEKCFTESMGTLLAGTNSGGRPAIVRAEGGDIVDNQGDCSPNNLKQDMVFRYRLNKSYVNTSKHLLDIQNPKDEETVTTTTTGGNGTLASGSARELAAQIIANPNITYDYGKAGPAAKQMQDLANGTDPGSCGRQMSTVLLGLIATLGQNHKVQISSLIRPSDNCGASAHGTECAVDIDFFDGQALTGNNAPSIALISSTLSIVPVNQPMGFGVGGGLGANSVAIQGRPVTVFNDNPNHVHIDMRCHV